ncbi:MAG: glycosyltransferase [Candidatus Magnetomorum sp.]|nr:glycosyltransferase [Candidatus Magnetomorum sp.]
MHALLINSLAGGGAEKVVLTVLTELLKRGHHIQLICLEKNTFYDVPDTVEIIYLSDAKGHENGIKKLLNLPFLAIKLTRIVKKYNIGVVQSHLFRANYVNILSRFLGSRHICQVVNTGAITAKYFNAGISGKINLGLIRWLYPKADLVINKAQGTLLDTAQRFRFNVPQIVIYNPVQLALIQSKQKEPLINKDFAFQPNRRYIITMARMHSQKCLHVLIHSFALISTRFPDTDLLFLGDGEERPQLEQLITDLQLKNRVFLIGQVRNPYKYLVRSHLFVLPSATEGFPNSLVEAMICKLPVISTDCMSGPREILAPESDVTKRIETTIEFAPYGVLVPVRNHVLLAEAMVKMLEDRSMCTAYAEKAHVRACMFSAEKIIDEYEQIIIGNQPSK